MDGTMLRVIVYDRSDSYVCDIDPTQILDLTATDEINGEHCVDLKTTQELAKTDRLLIRDGREYWHEYVVTGIEGEHGGRRVGAVVHEYHAVWSLQYDLDATYINDLYGCGVVPGHPSVPQTPRRGLECALQGTARWGVGTITVENMGSASFYRMSGWEGLQRVVENWGGELGATIEVGANGVTSRSVDLLAHTGSLEATRRFDYGGDLTRIRRKTSDDVWPCRIVPLGKSQETEAGGYTRRPGIESANGGVPWVQDDDVVPYTRIPDGNGDWEYPTVIVKNDVYEAPEEILAWAVEHVSEYTRPQVTYEADLQQLVRAGMDPHGVSLGDEVIVVDRTFGSEGLAIRARVVKVEQSLLVSTQTKLTIGTPSRTLGNQLGGMAREIQHAAEHADASTSYQSSAAYLQDLLDRLNAEANATGGWFYIVPGHGARCYDAPVTEPAVGAEATSAVDIVGGTIRIANTKTSGGDWEWRTVFTSGHIASELVTAAELEAGYIRGAGGTFIDLDGGTVQLGPTDGFHVVIDQSELGFYDGQTRAAYVNGGMLYIPLAVGVTAIQVGDIGDESWQWTLRENGNFRVKWTGD